MMRQGDRPNAASADAQHGLEVWVAAVAAELALDPAAADVFAVLDLAREVADGVGRPAAPVTTYLVGYAAGLARSASSASGRTPSAIATEELSAEALSAEALSGEALSVEPRSAEALMARVTELARSW